MVPMAMERTPPSFFWMAMRCTLKNVSAGNGGIAESGEDSVELAAGFHGVLGQQMVKVHRMDAVWSGY